MVVAPTTRHADTHEACDSRTYRKRAWCRAEIMSCWARNGTMSMYVSTNQGLRSLATNDSVLLEAYALAGHDVARVGAAAASLGRRGRRRGLIELGGVPPRILSYRI